MSIERATRAHAPATGRAAGSRASSSGGTAGVRAPAPDDLGPTDVLDLQRTAGNRAVTARLRTAQRAGGWTGADTSPGEGLAPGEPRTGWNVEEHAVGTVRRIPLDGLTGGLQSADGGDGAEQLTDEEVAGPVKGAARSDAAEREGRGRAIALLPATLDPAAPVTVLLHLHGHTENAGRGFAGWRQHEDTGKVRDVERDRIAQQIESAGSVQTMGLLPQGINKSQFGSINPDAYIADAFDRLTELRAWARRPANYRVVLSAHSGGGARAASMVAGPQPPTNLAMVALFDGIWGQRDRDNVMTWVRAEVDRHVAVLSDPRNATPVKDAHVVGAARLRAYYNPASRHYTAQHERLDRELDGLLGRVGDRLGTYRAAVRELYRTVPQHARDRGHSGHEGQVRTGLYSALVALPGAAGARAAPAPTPAQVPTGTPAPARPGAPVPVAHLERLITPQSVAAAAGPLGAGTFILATTVGMSRLRAAATVLATVERTEIDLTDALFALVHPELRGTRIPADREDLKAHWRTLRSAYARPALAAAPASAPARPSADVPTSGRVAPQRPAGVAAPAASPAGPATVLDPAQVRPAAAATGVTALTEEEKKAALDAALKQVQEAGRAADRDAIADTLAENGTDTETWWGGMAFDASFLDVPIQPSGGTVTGVHGELHARLAMAETTLQGLFPGLSKAQIAGQMGIYRISGVRPPKKATGGSMPSYHCFGLAIDINHPTNPFVGNKKPTLDKDKNKVVTEEEQKNYDLYMESRSPRIIERAMLLLHHEEFDVESRITVPAGPGSRASRLWEVHHRASEALAAYLRLASDPDGPTLRGLVDSLRATGDTRDLAYWKKRIADDKVLITPWDFMHHTSPETGGYMDLGKELVEALMGAGLLWGGEYSGAKDLMHFDYRGGTIARRPGRR